MSIVFNCRCLTCGEDLSADDAVEQHLEEFTDHIVSEVMYDSDHTSVSSSEGVTKVSDGELYTLDSTRNKWLSVNRIGIEWGKASSNCRNLWLRLGTQIPLNSSLVTPGIKSKPGFLVSRPAVITKMMASRQRGDKEWMVSICRDSNYRDRLYTMKVGKDFSKTDYAIDVDIKEGVTLHCYHESRKSGYPYVWIELAWMID